jgi:MFS transporter, putative metabolite transport protein
MAGRTHLSGETAVTAAERRTVQDYIDELPLWRDGTALSTAPITAMQWRIWLLATAGKFFEGFVVFMTGVALPLIAQEFGLSTVQHGVVGAAPLLGILLGASVLGGLADRYGRKAMFIAEMAILVVFLAAVSVSPSFVWLVVGLLGASVLGGLADRYGRKAMFIAEMAILVVFLAAVSVSPSFVWLVVGLLGVGVALGCDYPTAHLIISESIPSRTRGRFVLGAFAFQAVGALVGTGIGALILAANPDVGAWRWMYGTAIVPAMLVLFARFFVTQSAHWLLTRGRTEEAEREMRRLLRREPPYPSQVRLRNEQAGPDPAVPGPKGHYRLLFGGKHRRATVLASVPWFCRTSQPTGSASSPRPS